MRRSLRIVKTATGIRLTWQAGLGPYGVYRSPDADDIVRPAWLVGGSVADLSWDEPAATAPPGSIFFYSVTAPLPCTSVADCDDHRPCDGTEFCDARTRRCAEGAPLVCNDGDPCTEDACDEQTVGCVFTPLQCEDGNPCTIDECRPDSGCYATVDPAAGVGLPAQVAGRSLTAFPLFDFVDVFKSRSELIVPPPQFFISN